MIAHPPNAQGKLEAQKPEAKPEAQNKDRPLMQRLRTLIDPYLLMLIGTITLAALFPPMAPGWPGPTWR
jgi:hypothetical protein